MTPLNEQGPFRVDVTDDGIGWASNARRFDTLDEAEGYAQDLFSRWLALKAWRVVPASTPDRERVDHDADLAKGFPVSTW